MNQSIPVTTFGGVATAPGAGGAGAGSTGTGPTTAAVPLTIREQNWVDNADKAAHSISAPDSNLLPRERAIELKAGFQDAKTRYEWDSAPARFARADGFFRDAYSSALEGADLLRVGSDTGNSAMVTRSEQLLTDSQENFNKAYEEIKIVTDLSNGTPRPLP